ncbi:hypothetical protein CDD81_7843 [Ophiocordyceps australis]|uniref:Uncharacterized protein n=1 Tax=Ophiocordyceps australis TaxID=1399860 RepID=A0A2C5YFJ0_9HYPO|nr:hypothetical protein CDD81_7843 [Ophiocordyceps australis]
MALKRKCSDSELGSSPREGSVSSMGGASRDAAPHLPSRTMKRFRNSRPSEQQVHEHTLGLLYSAQRQPRGISPIAEPQQSPRVDDSAQQTLHHFWTIRSVPSRAPLSVVPVEQTTCHDCGADMAADIKMHGASMACICCAKRVCRACAVANLSQDRRCLHCVGSTVWSGSTDSVPVY